MPCGETAGDDIDARNPVEECAYNPNVFCMYNQASRNPVSDMVVLYLSATHYSQVRLIT